MITRKEILIPKIYGVILVCVLLLSTQANAQYATVDFTNMSLAEMLDFKVRTSKTNESISDMPASVVLINRDEIAKYGFTRVEEILEHVTGLFMTDDYYWLGTVNYGVRGFYSSGPFNNLIVMLNGVNQMEEFTRGTPLSKVNVPVEAIDYIEVVRGPMSVLYGSGAFLGAINIITNEEHENHAGVSYGSRNSKNTYASVSAISENISLDLAFGLRQSNGLDMAYTDLTTNPIKPNGNTFLENNGLTNDARTTGQLAELGKFMSMQTTFRGFSFSTTYSNNRNGMMDTQPTIDEGSYFVNQSMIMSGMFNHSFTNNLSIQLKETYSVYSDYINYEQDYSNTNMNSNQSSSFIETELQLYHQAYNGKLETLFGLHNRYIDLYNWGGDYSFWGDNYRNFLTRLESPYYFNSAYLQHTLNLKKWTFVAGLRAEIMSDFTIVRYNDYDVLNTPEPFVLVRPYTYSNTKLQLIPRLASVYKINKNNIVKFMYGRAIKQPSMADLQQFAIHPYWPTLQPSEIETLELNYINSISKYASVNLSLFHNYIDNLITRIDIFQPDGTMVIESSNAGQMLSHGIELRVMLRPIDKLMLDLSGSYNISKDKTKGREDIVMAYSPRFLGYARGIYSITDGLSVAATWRYVGEMESYYDNKFANPENLDEGKIGRVGIGSDAYHVFGLNLRASNIWKGLFIDCKLSNVLDTEVRYPTTTANAWMDKGALGKGRAVYLSLGYNFY